MSYLNAPQTELIATSCCVCARALCDSVSVELGIGPVCRSKFGFDMDADEATRAAANALVHRIAVNQSGEQALDDCRELRTLGFEKLADRITERLAGRAGIIIAEVDGGYLVTTPYNEEATPAWRCVPGRRWNRDEKANFVPVGARGDLWALLRTYFAGSVALGPKGGFVIN
jgi:hypothetical protein